MLSHRPAGRGSGDSKSEFSGNASSHGHGFDGNLWSFDSARSACSLLERPRHIGLGDPIAVEEPGDLGRIDGVQSGRRQFPPLGGPGAADDALLEPIGQIVRRLQFALGRSF
jgi:hypothetical protein